MTDADDNPVMRIEGLRFGYEAGRPVLEEIGASVQRGLLHAIIGPNAAGKTTLLRLMLGQLKPWAGVVQLDGQPVRRLDARSRARRLAYVPQRSTVGFAFTVRQVVSMGRHALPDDPSAIDAALERCDLRELAARPFPELSVGQQQRVLLARALAQAAGQGAALLLDEPVSAMDLQHIHRVMQILQAEARRGLAVVTVLHDLNLTALYADVVWVLHEGRLALAGDWEDVLRPERLEPIYGVRLEELRRPVDPGDPTARRPIFDVRLPEQFELRP